MLPQFYFKEANVVQAAEMEINFLFFSFGSDVDQRDPSTGLHLHALFVVCL